jgi:hypothetical protein
LNDREEREPTTSQSGDLSKQNGPIDRLTMAREDEFSFVFDESLKSIFKFMKKKKKKKRQLKKNENHQNMSASSSSLSELEPGAFGSPAPGARRVGHLTNQRRVESTHHGSALVEDNEESCM